MAQRLEDLVVRISGDTASLNRSVNQASRNVDGFARNASKSFSSLGSSIRAAAGALAAFGVATQIKSFTQAAIGLGSAVSDTAARLGTTSEAIQRLRAAAEPAGVSAEKLDSSLRRLSKNVGEAQQGTGELSSALKGTNDELLNALKGARDSGEAFLILSDAISKIESPTERARIAAAALGRGGVELLEVLGMGRDRLEEIGDEAERFGLILSNETAASLDAFGDSIEQLSRVALTQFAEGIAEGALGAKSLTDVIADPDTIAQVGDMAREIAVLVGQIASLAAEAKAAGDYVADLLNSAARAVGLGVGNTGGATGDFSTGATGSFGDPQVPATEFGPFGPRPGGPPRTSRVRSASRAGGSRRNSSAGIGPDLQFLDTSNLLKGEINAYEKANEAALKSFDEMVKKTGDLADEALATIERRAETFGDFLGGVVGNFVNGAETDWKRLAQSFIAQLLEMQVAAAASELFKIGSRAVAGASASGGGGLGGFLSTILGAFSGFAEGGIVTRPTLAMIGEGGESEAVIPLSQLRGMVGGGGTVVNIHNSTGADVQTERRRGSDGQDVIDVMVGSSVKRLHARSELRQQFGQRHAPGVG